MSTASELTAQAEEIAASQPGLEIEVIDEPAVAVTYGAPVAMPGPSPMAELSTIPEQNELRTLAQLATTFAYSQLVPKPLQTRPEDCLLVLLTARDLGLSTTVAFRECHPIDGRVTVSPKLKLAIVRQRALGKVWAEPTNDITHQTWSAVRADDPSIVYRVTYTWADAQRAELVRAGCTADDHSEQCKKGWGYGATRDQRAKSCKQNWRTYPGQMLQWRAVGYLMDQAFGEVGVGLYGADELGAVTDEDGHVIDVMESGPLDGMPDHTPEPKAPGTDPNEIAPEDIREQFKERVYRLPHPAIETIREQWARRQQDDTPMIWPLPVLPLRQVRSADALIAGFEARAERGEWGPWNPDPLSWEVVPDGSGSDSKGGRSAPGGEDAGAVAQDGAQPEGETVPDAPEPAIETVPDAESYDPKNPPSEVIEAAIDRANDIPDDELDAALVEAGQKVIASHKPGTKRRRLCQAWFIAQWRPEPDSEPSLFDVAGERHPEDGGPTDG